MLDIDCTCNNCSIVSLFYFIAGNDVLLKSIKIPCLGQPFELGMMYDSYNDCLVPEMIWNLAEVRQYTSFGLKHFSECIILDRNTDMFGDKCSRLGIGEELKLSCLIGLTKLSGSSIYLHCPTSSHCQERVCIIHSRRSKFERLSIDHMWNKPLLCNLKDTSATHVVTEISYGADAVFVFDRVVGKTKRKQTILKGIVKKLQDGEMKYDLQEISNISCKLYSDIPVGNMPNTFEDAIEVFKCLCSSNEVVPKEAFLLPLSQLHPKVEKKYITINLHLSNSIQSIIEKFSLLDMNIDHLRNSDTSHAFVVFQVGLPLV